MALIVEGVAPLIGVFDMPTSVAFYRDVLGFTVVKQSGSGDDFDWGLLQLGGAEFSTQPMIGTSGPLDPLRVALQRMRTRYSTLVAGTWMPHTRICGRKGSTCSKRVGISSARAVGSDDGSGAY